MTYIIDRAIVYKSGGIPPHLANNFGPPKILIEFLKDTNTERLLEKFLIYDTSVRPTLSDEISVTQIIFKDEAISEKHPSLDNLSLQQFLCCDVTKKLFKEFLSLRRRRLP